MTDMEYMSMNHCISC